MPDLTVSQALEIATAHHQAGRLLQAQALYRSILLADRNHAEALHRLGVIACQTGHLEEAEELLRRAIAANGAVADFHSNLGNLLSMLGRAEEAIACFERAVRIGSEDADIFSNFGAALGRAGRNAEAAEWLRRALALRPKHPGASCNLARILEEAGKPDEAAVCASAALAEGVPAQQQAPLHHVLGNALQSLGRFEEAQAQFRRAVDANPRNVKAHNNLLFSLLTSEAGLAEFPEEVKRWNAQHAEGLRSNWLWRKGPTVPIQADQNGELGQKPQQHGLSTSRGTLGGPEGAGSSGGRALRVGFVSADFRDHPVGRFLLPFLDHYDRSSLSIFCYSSGARSDAATPAIQQRTTWRDISMLNDAQAAQTIHDDEVDILIDLSLHTTGSRLLVFARRPAPVQATYLAYCGTSGMAGMDYRITDSWLDPPVFSQPAGFTEKPALLARSYWCYRPHEAAPDVGDREELPEIMFGSLNAPWKINSQTVEAWAGVLRALPRSRMMIHAIGDQPMRLREQFAALGVEAARLEFVPRRTPAEYFAAAHQIDIALDTFPYPGGTTTCNMLWMGVPVVTLAGATPLSRGGVSILQNVGLPELIANTAEQYIQIAARLAANRTGLAGLRKSLRPRMLASPLMDEPGFARDFEGLLRQMWEQRH